MPVEVWGRAPGAYGPREPLSPGRGRPLPAPPLGGLFPRRGSEGRRAARGAAAEGRGAEPIGALVAGANGGGRDMAGAVGGGRARIKARWHQRRGAGLSSRISRSRPPQAWSPRRLRSSAGKRSLAGRCSVPGRRCQPGSAPGGSGSECPGTREGARAPSRRGPACGEVGLLPQRGR